MKPTFTLLLLLSFLILSSCASAPQTEKQIVRIYATSSAQSWLAETYSCAEELFVAIKIETNDPDIYLRSGEPETITSPAYKIGEEEILVAANNAIQVESISQTEMKELFAQGNPSIQIWVFASGEDIQQAFDQLALSGIRAVPSARIASGVEQMSATLNSESNAIGILPKRALAGNIRALYSVGTIPVLAITKGEPQGAIAGLISCLQK